MKNLYIYMVLFLALFGCGNDQNKNKPLFHHAPNNAAVILQVQNLSSFCSNSNSNPIISNLKNIKALEYFNLESEALICFGKDKKDSTEVLIATSFSKSPFKIDSTTNHTIETFKNKDISITKTTIDKQIFYSTLRDSTLIITNRASLLETPNASPKTSHTRSELLQTTNNNSSFSIYINSSEVDHFSKLFKSGKFTSHTVLDGDISQNTILLNGVTKANDSSKSLINIFRNTVPQRNRISEFAPNTTKAMLSATFNSFLTLDKNIDRGNDSTAIEIHPILETTIEIGNIEIEEGTASLLYTLGGPSAFETLESFETEEKFRDVDIYKFNTPSAFNSMLPIFKIDALDYFVQIEDAFLFAKDTQVLKTIISHYQNNSTMASNYAFESMMETLSDESSLFLYNNKQRLEQNLLSLLGEDIDLDLKGYDASAIQFIYDTDFAHVNAVTKKHKQKPSSNTVSEELSITLEHPILNTPQLFYNHYSNQKDIVVQDIENNLYLISNEGKIFWKKKLNGKILGNIQQMDIYKNGRFQLVFATPNRVYVLDRNGNDVENFPLTFNDEITQPLSLFDYDKNKTYRLLVTQGKSLLMYDKMGDRVKGFTYNTAPNTIGTQPKHIRIGRKDYIVFIQGKTMEILDRTGKTRIDIKDEFDFSGNDIYLYNNTFATTTTNGIFVQFDQNGKLSSVDLSLKTNHKLTTTTKTLVTLSENKLGIKSRDVELDFGEYTAPRIFYIYDKIYVTTTNLQSNRVLLFDSQAKSIPDFPIYGNSEMVLDNIDKDRNLEVVVKGSENSIIVYQIN